MPDLVNPFGSGVKTARVALSAPQIRGLLHTPLVLVPAQGPNTVIIPISIIGEGVFGTVQYTAGLDFNGGFPTFSVGGLLLAQFSEQPQRFITVPAGKSLAFIPGGAGLPSFPSNSHTATAAAMANQPLVMSTVPSTDFGSGPIVTAAVANGGAGYLLNDTGTIDPSALVSSGDATYQVTAVSGTAVTTIAVTSPGSSYNVANGMQTGTSGAQPGVGVGLTLNILTVTPGDGTAVVTVSYIVVTLS